jgi:hypothetical protein
MPFLRSPHNNCIPGSLHLYAIITDIEIPTIVLIWMAPFPCCPGNTKCMVASLMVGVPAGCDKYFILMQIEMYIPRIVHPKISTWWGHFHTIEGVVDLGVTDSVSPTDIQTPRWIHLGNLSCLEEVIKVIKDFCG